jgi:xanthine dehydrogenase accessory factor
MRGDGARYVVNFPGIASDQLSWITAEQAENALQMGVSKKMPVWLVEVQSAQGSVPRGNGTRMLVCPSHAQGTIGGGHLELQALRMAREAMARGDAEFCHAFALGPALGQCCGGALALRFAPLAASDVAAWPAPVPRFHLQLYGAGHVGRALMRQLAALPCAVEWIDERDSELAAYGATLPAHIVPICADAVEAEVAHAPPDAFFLVMTHSHDLDLRICEAVLRRGQFAWLGLIGSATKKARFLRQLAARGLAQPALDRLTSPIGVPGIVGKEPELIALAVAAQLMQLTG